MLRTFLRAKLHRAAVTSADPDYEGSISIDRALCREAGLLEFEQVDIYDINNGARFTTYVIYGQPGQIQINGAAARLVDVGDRVIITYPANVFSSPAFASTWLNSKIVLCLFRHELQTLKAY